MPVLLLLIAFMLPARADLVIEITEGVEDPIPMAFVPFQWQGAGALPVEIAGLVEKNLRRTGLFDPIPRSNMLSRPSQESEVIYRDWRLLNAEFLLVGRVQPLDNDQVRLEYELFDVFGRTRVQDGAFVGPVAQLRRMGHALSDQVFEYLTGKRGVFQTKLAYVTVERRSEKDQTFRLMVADADGANQQTVFTSAEPIMGPAWSPEGQRLAYVSFENNQSRIFIQELATGQRQLVADFDGQNTSPSFSPDGRSLVFVNSSDGNPELYLVNIRTRAVSRLTRSGAIDSEPKFSDDGRRILFTSNRAGNPHLYQLSLAGGAPERLTFEGRYNSNGDYVPESNKITFVHQFDRDFQIGVMDLADGIIDVVTTSGLDESPSPAPNGQMLVYATSVEGRGVLGLVSIDGRVGTLIPSRVGDVREPAWSPYLD